MSPTPTIIAAVAAGWLLLGAGWAVRRWMAGRRADAALRDQPWVRQLDDDDRPRRRQRGQHPGQHRQRGGQR